MQHAVKWQTYIGVPVERVYRTLTTANGWDAWFTRGTSLDEQHITMRWRDAKGHRVSLWGAGHETMEIGGKVVAMDAPHRFAFEWSPAGHPTLVDFTLTARGPGTVVVVTDCGYTDADLGATGVVGEMTESSPLLMCASGWGEALMMLKVYLEHGVVYGDVPPPA
jgi:uncharacterized protein YndB with AHSA1/START domain